MLLAAGPAFAQSAPAAKDTKGADQKGEQARPVLQPPQPTQNVRLDLTITDQRGEGTALTKTMTVTVVDSGMGRIRTNGEVRTPMGSRSVILNVDVQPRIMRDGKVRVDLSLEYRPLAAEAETEKSSTPGLNEMIGVLLEDGKSMVISQSADPATDRKVRVEAKATIIR
jgi:hypothetical protein